jgi:hypothetical protein
LRYGLGVFGYNRSVSKSDSDTEIEPPRRDDFRVEIVRSDGSREAVPIADAIAVYERRRDEAREQMEHCEQRIEELKKRWERGLKGRVLRSNETSDSQGQESE